MNVPPAVRDLVDRLEGAGFETWTVGGAVRDALRGRPGRAEDWDLATRAKPREVQRLFRRTVPLGVEYGTVGVFGRDGALYEVTTFRHDVLTYGRRAVVAFADTLDEDLARRDFTVNAIAWHPLRGELRDPHGGREDLARGRLRAVGQASKRFREDYLRLLRGLRFAGALGLTIDDATWEAMAEAVPGLARLSMERVREEMLRVLGAPTPSRSLALYEKCGALAQLFPGFQGALDEAALAAVDALGRRRPVVRMAALLALGFGSRAGDDETGETLERLRFSNRDAERIRRIASGGAAPTSDLARPARRRRWTAAIGAGAIRDVFRVWIAVLRTGARATDADLVGRVVAAARADLRRGVPLATGELALRGRDLVALGWPPGPAIGDALRHLLELVWEDPTLDDRDALIEAAAAWQRTRSGEED